MAELKYIDKENIEIFLGMGSGYVLDFSNQTFQEFVKDAVDLDINDPKYNYDSNSKAKRLRQFIKAESNYVVGKLLSAFCNYWYTKFSTGKIGGYHRDETLYKKCVQIADELKQKSIVENIDAIKPNVDDLDFKRLGKIIRESIEKNEPEAALDRLHTFMFKYLRELCNKHNITYVKKDTLNAIYGKYIKFIVDNKYIESKMSEQILKYSINIIDAFNTVRNDHSFAHDNPILNYNESILIFNNISSSINFIEFIETQIEKANDPKKAHED